MINLISEKQKPGEYRVIWNGKNRKGNDATSGIYFIQLRVDNHKKIIKSLLIK